MRKACDTTGTATASGYTEAAYNWDVALRTRRVLRSRGARVLLTRQDNRSVGPCIDERARIANRARADLRVSIHADGGPPGGCGFHVIEPALIRGLTDDVFARLAPARRRRCATRSARDRRAVRELHRPTTASPAAATSAACGSPTCPSVFIETGNMRNAGDARRLRQRRATGCASRAAIADGIERFLAR